MSFPGNRSCRAYIQRISVNVNLELFKRDNNIHQCLPFPDSWLSWVLQFCVSIRGTPTLRSQCLFLEKPIFTPTAVAKIREGLLTSGSYVVYGRPWDGRVALMAGDELPKILWNTTIGLIGGRKPWVKILRHTCAGLTRSYAGMLW